MTTHFYHVSLNKHDNQTSSIHHQPRQELVLTRVLQVSDEQLLTGPLAEWLPSAQALNGPENDWVRTLAPCLVCTLVRDDHFNNYWKLPAEISH